MMIIYISIITFFSTFLGGVFALKYKDKLSLIMAFTGGVILGLIFFEIIPEIMDLSISSNIDIKYPMLTFLLGFFIFHIIEKLFSIHNCNDKNYQKHSHKNMGVLSATALVLHSFLDGVGIGSGFKIDILFGIFISIAVIGHDFADGLNTVSILLSHKNSNNKAVIFLIIDSIAPVLGVLLSFYLNIPTFYILLYLGYFAGSLLYIATSDILPQAHKENGSKKTILLSMFGIIFMYLLSIISRTLN